MVKWVYPYLLIPASIYVESCHCCPSYCFSKEPNTLLPQAFGPLLPQTLPWGSGSGAHPLDSLRETPPPIKIAHPADSPPLTCFLFLHDFWTYGSHLCFLSVLALSPWEQFFPLCLEVSLVQSWFSQSICFCFFFCLRKISPELTSVTISLHFIRGLLPQYDWRMAWVCAWDPKPWTPGYRSGVHELNHYTTGPAPHKVFDEWMPV